MKLLKAGFVAVALMMSAGSAGAQSAAPDYDDTPTAAAMAFDLVIVRPLGLVGTVAGVGLFVIDLPFSLLRGKPPKDSAERFIVQPAKFTFTRDLGRMETE